MYNLQNILKQKVREGELYQRLDEKRIRCYACGQCCPIPEGHVGVCRVRFNRGGKLMVPWGYVGGVQCDPIEKKPFFHAFPGALAYSFGIRSEATMTIPTKAEAETAIALMQVR